jgi:hypothetical protein
MYPPFFWKISIFNNVLCRSAALFHVKMFEDCIEDINRALAAGYPKEQQLYSLYLRKAQCLKFLDKDYADCLAEAIMVCNFLKLTA